VTIAGNTQWTIGGDAQWTVGKSLQQAVGVNHVMDIGKDLSIRAGQNYVLQVQRLVRLTAGDDAVLQVGKSLVVNTGAMFQFVAAQTGTLQVGGSFIGMKRDGDIDIFGRDIDAKASGELTLKGSKLLQN
jgi:type VI secretion system secreted protein VgrG